MRLHDATSLSDFGSAEALTRKKAENRAVASSSVLSSDEAAEINVRINWPARVTRASPIPQRCALPTRKPPLAAMRSASVMLGLATSRAATVNAAADIVSAPLYCSTREH